MAIPKKKIKIISERVKQPFKEVREEEIVSEEKTEEENLEEQLEPETEQFIDFSDFATGSSGEAIVPILRTTREVQESPELEEELKNVPFTETIRAKEAGREGDYSVGTSDYITREQIDYEGLERQERKFEVRDIFDFGEREKDIFELRQAQELTQETGEERSREEKKYHELKMEEEERKIPFSRERRRRERVLK